MSKTIEPKLKPKRGRRPGREWPLSIPVMVSADQDEYIARLSFRGGVSKSRMMREAILSRGWEITLAELRLEQKSIPQTFRREPK